MDEFFYKQKVNDFENQLASSFQPTEQGLIDKHIIPKGGVYKEDSFNFLQLTMLLPSIMIGYRAIENAKPLPKVYFEVVNNNILNATAIKTSIDNTYLILMNKGLFKEIEDFIEKFLHFRGNEYREYYVDSKDWISGLFNQIIIEHELSHIFNGHLDLIEKLFKEAQIDENRNDGTDVEFNFLMQTLEMDADCTALSRLYGLLYNHAKIPNHSLVHDFLKAPEQSFSDLIMCFYVTNKKE